MIQVRKILWWWCSIKIAKNKKWHVFERRNAKSQFKIGYIETICVFLIIFFCIGLTSAPLSFNVKSLPVDQELLSQNEFFLGGHAPNSCDMENIFPDLRDESNNLKEIYDWILMHKYILGLAQGLIDVITSISHWLSTLVISNDLPNLGQE